MSSIISILPYLIGLCAVATLLVLFAGLVTMAGSVSAHDKYGNILMRWRVGLQAATVALVALLIALKSIA